MRQPAALIAALVVGCVMHVPAVPLYQEHQRQQQHAWPSPPPPVNPNLYSTSPLIQTLYDEALPRLAARHAAVSKLTTAEQWKERQQMVKPRLEQLFGPFPPANRTKPNVHSAALNNTVSGDGFIVKKMAVETRPGYYVPSALWLPSAHADDVDTLIPAILYATGHEGTGNNTSSCYPLREVQGV